MAEAIVVQPVTISGYETGTSPMPLATLCRMCETLHADPAAAFGSGTVGDARLDSVIATWPLLNDSDRSLVVAIMQRLGR